MDLRLYVKESYNELVNKVTWPTWPHLFQSTTVVIIASAIIALIIAVMDFLSNSLTDLFYGL